LSITTTQLPLSAERITLSGSFLRASKALTKVILSADKGNCVVVMGKHDYREKALSLLNDRNTYSILKSDPTGKTQRGLKLSYFF
jgi:hypothetical protein